MTQRILSQPCFKRAINERLGVPKPPNYYKFGNKAGNIFHTQLRTEMSNLNSHRFQISKSDSPGCSCGYYKEDVRHFVLFCRNYIIPRNTLFQTVSEILGINFNETLPDFKLNVLIYGKTLSDRKAEKIAYIFQNFLIKTKRL